MFSRSKIEFLSQTTRLLRESKKPSDVLTEALSKTFPPIFATMFPSVTLLDRLFAQDILTFISSPAEEVLSTNMLASRNGLTIVTV